MQLWGNHGDVTVLGDGMEGLKLVIMFLSVTPHAWIYKSVILNLWILTLWEGQTTLSWESSKTIKTHKYLHYDL